ncbi:MAG: DUF2142 domain-containing protein [Actinobacteria bacterium]|nr:DUF2142 domain-containing protein [Actinomycetota bacterium]
MCDRESPAAPETDESERVSRFFSDRARVAAILLVAITLVKGLLFASLVPAWEAPDEQKYFAEVSRLADRGELRSLTGHPLLYSVAAYLPYKLGGKSESNRVLAVRLLSVLFTAVTVLFTYKVARTVFPENEFIQVLAPAVATFNPQFTFIGASVNSDSMIAMWFSVIAYLSVLVMRDSLDFKKGIAILALSIAGALTKQRIYALYPIVLAVMGYGLVRRSKASWSNFWEGAIKLRDVALAATFVGVIFASWPIFTGLAVGASLNGFPLLRLLDITYILGGENALMSVAPRMFFHFWGYFGWLTIPMTPWFYQVYGILSALSALGLLLSILRSLARLLAERFKNQARARMGTYAAQLVFLVCSVLISFYAVLAYNVLLSGGAQGRYLFIAIAPIATLFAAGLAWILPRGWRRPALPVLILTLALLNSGALLYVISPYYY